MNSALYFPFTEPKNTIFIKNALFLWDSVDFIVPWRGFTRYNPDVETAEALEIVARNYVPTDDEKSQIHEELMDICISVIPESLYFNIKNSETYDFYPQKLLPETWDMLVESNLASVIKQNSSINSAATNSLFGYYMMSVVAVCCAAGRKRLVTDENDPYRTLGNILVNDQAKDDTIAAENWHGRLVAMTLGAPDLSEVPISQLIKLRKNESQLLKEMRQTFVKSLDDTVLEISKHTDNINNLKEIIRNFTNTMETDLKELKRALGRSAVSTILSPVGGITVLSACASFVAPAANLVTVGGLTKSLMDYQDRRHKILSEHPSAWLFAGTKQFKIC